MKTIHVLIVDDSALIREMFTKILNSDPEINVIGVAVDPFDAREKIKELNPDVITLDIEMPKMDGITFLKKIMALRPMPVVMVSSLTKKGAKATIEALEYGAVDYLSKSGSDSFDVDNMKDELIAKVKAASKAKVSVPNQRPPAIVPEKAPSGYKSGFMIAIGSSTGGVEALRDVIPLLPKNSPPVVIVQHMPAKFTPTFAARLDSLSEITVVEAKHGMKIEQGHAYLAPGGQHLEVGLDGMNVVCLTKKSDLVMGHMPSVNVLFSSVAKVKRSQAVGVMLTGMGKDGAAGMLEMKKAGAYNISQNEESCVVYGMPKAAYLAGAVDSQHTLSSIADAILKQCS